ncbi:helix-turn-helix domain-containing protein [Marinagarivorans cellulosilyticus]|uniref:HTH araC/xylS-type domain-containing protein n=1 Tax=Marinagarivorans cellulosilyticus TaxID=2721545 RepID=A0AAN1WLH7_9GAMM|nr:helix-turn-helix domain-containing protein [Marinagarivorans cellulosilyticus]BCD99806.1 hypothetical protein MARGE09_P4008 [Marinagarivorans cellulosilyticus]
MQSIHFSMIDIVLIVATLQCALVFGLVVIARALPTPSPICRHLLGLLFIAIGMDAAAILLVWQADVRAALAPVAGLVIAFASFAFTAKGPLLLLFVQTLTTPQFQLRPVHILHLSAFAMALAVAFTNGLDIERITYSVESDLPNPGTNTWWTLMRLVPCIYALAAIYTLRKAPAVYSTHSTNDQYPYHYWIKALVWGFFAQWSLNLGVHIAGNHISFELANTLGIINDFAILVWVNALLFYSFKVIRTLSPLQQHQIQVAPAEPAKPVADVVAVVGVAVPEEPASEVFVPEVPAPYVIKTGMQSQPSYLPRQQRPANNFEEHEALGMIVSGIDDKQLHLQHTLNVDKFSDAVELPSREVSRLINAYFDCSFAEFINAFRTYEAEQLLSCADHADAAINDIIGRAGFNSKSAFHRFFKRFTGLSPSEYRKHKSSNKD